MALCKFCRVSLVLVTLVVQSALTACLPADTRPEPGSLATSVVGEDALRAGFATADGWEISFDEFLISLGEVVLEGDDCNPYAESDYLRILDMRQPGAQRLNLMVALGTCEFSFLVEDPSRDAVLGTGVDEAKKDMMRTAGSDPFVEGRGVALHVTGSAVRADELYRFAWSFRQNLAYTDCGDLEFASGASDELEIGVRGRVLFQAGPDDDAPLQFDDYAAADVDADGNITLEELHGILLPASDDYATLGERLYLGLVPEVARFRDSAACSIMEPEDDF
ncbi:MAG TPA: hypothetical protein VFU02_19340 [Polyangiaceae bacterium]|nr:hypothetical protein [Polyangiaceae bacterium]